MKFHQTCPRRVSDSLELRQRQRSEPLCEVERCNGRRSQYSGDNNVVCQQPCAPAEVEKKGRPVQLPKVTRNGGTRRLPKDSGIAAKSIPQQCQQEKQLSHKRAHALADQTPSSPGKCEQQRCRQDRLSREQKADNVASL